MGNAPVTSTATGHQAGKDTNMQNYFIGQGTHISAQFDTLEEMLSYHAKMPDLDRHFCKLYDRISHRIASGHDIGWPGRDPWRNWT